MTSRLALDGAAPVRAEVLPYGRHSIDDDDIAAVVEALRSDWLTTGPRVDQFETEFARHVGARYAVAVSNGTAALHAAMYAAGIGPGDEVIVPVMTFVASANCVRFQGGTVVFVDVRPDTLTLDTASVRKAIGPRTRAIVAVDFAGHPADLDELNAIAGEHRLKVIQDAAHSLGGRYRTRPVGSIADFTTFSLHPVKNITSGEGGVVTTADEHAAIRMRNFRNHCISATHRQREASGSWRYEVSDLGYNLRLTDLQSALALSQLMKLDRWLARRRAIALQYDEAFSHVSEIIPPVVLPHAESAWHLYIIRLRLERLRVGREQVFRALRAENIGVNVQYIPVPWHPYYQRLGYMKGQWPVGESAYEEMLSLPMFPAMTDADVRDVIEAVGKVVDHYRCN